MTDLALSQLSVGTFGVTLNGNDLQSDDGLETAVIVSLFSDKRLANGEEPNDGTDDPRGWWGDIGDADGIQIGSYLWLLWREKMLPPTINRAIEYARDALQWLIEDGIAQSVNVTGERAGLYQISLAAEIIRPTGQALRYAYLWDGERAKFQRKDQ